MQNFMDAFSLAGKNALVLCAEHTYGAEMVRGLTRAGAKVWLAGAVDPKLPGVEGFFHYEHIDAEETARLADYARKEMGVVDVMVENVLNMPTAPGWSHNFATINEQAQTAMKGMMMTVQAIGSIMAEQGHGSVILATDYGAVVGYDPQNYLDCPADFVDQEFSLLRGFIRGSCVNYARQSSGYLSGHGCRCNALAFGPLAGKQPQAFEDAFIRHSQHTRLASEDDIAYAVVFMASDASAFITGQTIPVDGGYTAK